jgi:acetylornithine/succinyldiaminopimelate/putrescine aminotransferase
MQVRHGGLEVIMSQAVFDIGGGVPPGEHVDSTGVAKAVHRVDNLETFRRQGHGEVFSAKAIDAVAGEFLTALIDKEALLIEGLRGWSESRDIELKELRGFGLQFDEAEAIAFAQDGEGFLLGVEVVQVKSGHFTGPGA